MSRPGWLALSAAIVALVAAVIAWRSEPSASQASGPTALGLFQAKGCASCHDGPDTTAHAGFPSLRNAPAWAATRRDGMSASEYVAESIRTPSAFISPAWTGDGAVSGMPELALTDDEITVLVDYLLLQG